MLENKPLIEIQSWQEVPEFSTEAEEATFWSTHALGESLLEKMAALPDDLLPTPRSQPIKSELLKILDQLPEPLLVEVRDFAEFLHHKHGRLTG
jgi:hypothetical protein